MAYLVSTWMLADTQSDDMITLNNLIEAGCHIRFSTCWISERNPSLQHFIFNVLIRQIMLNDVYCCMFMTSLFWNTIRCIE